MTNRVAARPGPPGDGGVVAVPRLTLPPACGIAEAAQVQELLMAHLAAHPSLDIDLSAVTRADLTLLQLLSAAARSAGKAVQLEGAVPTVVRDLVVAAGAVGSTNGTAAERALWEQLAR